MTHIIQDIDTSTYSEPALKQKLEAGMRMKSIDVLRAVTMFLMIFVKGKRRLVQCYQTSRNKYA